MKIIKKLINIIAIIILFVYGYKVLFHKESFEDAIQNPILQHALDSLYECEDLKCYASDEVIFPVIMTNISEAEAQKQLNFVNESIEGVSFKLTAIKNTQIPTISELKAGAYDRYYDLVDSTNTDTLTIFYTPSPVDCRMSGCSLVRGFSVVGSATINSVVMAQRDTTNPLILTHEIGHWLGLSHTFSPEEDIADTPPDDMNEMEIDYYNCNHNIDDRLVNNFMSYYKPCYLRQKSFTPQQQERMQLIAREVKLTAKL